MSDNIDSLSSLTRREISTIREICSIAVVQAAGALSKLMDIGVTLSVPDLHALPPEEMSSLFGEMNVSAVGVLIPFRGDIQGNMLLLFPDDGAGELNRILFPQGGVENRELVDSAFREIGNILSGVFLTILSRLSGQIILKLPPIIARDMAGALLDAILADIGSTSDRIIALSSSMEDSSENPLVKVVIIPDPGGLDLFLAAGKRLVKLDRSSQGSGE